ncbi:MAG: hypothetical protein PVF58_18415 [Candidatus Methanofastidiosia archaeon]|jgi:hypothetical protein
MNERHEERQQRSGERGRGPKIVSIQEPEPEERAPPIPPVREYSLNWIKKPATLPRIIGSSPSTGPQIVR